MITVYFHHGHVSGMEPIPQNSYYESRNLIYDADLICSDGLYFDLNDKSSIYAIPVPDYGRASDGAFISELGVTGYIEYVLRMKASAHKSRGADDIAYACLGQATKFMLFSDLGWREQDFWRIVEWLERDGRLSYAAKWEKWIFDHVQIEDEKTLESFRRIVVECQSLGTDLVYIPWAGAQSGAVAKYQGRIYSLNGIDRKFPLLPDFIKKRGCVIPPFGGRIAGPFILWNDKKLDTISYRGIEKPALRISWRPFEDDRTEEEKRNYYDLQHKFLSEKHSKRNLRLYDRLKAAFPDICPKSISTFYRWETSKPEIYQSIISAANESNIPYPRKEFIMPKDIEPSDPDPAYCGGRKRPLFL